MNKEQRIILRDCGTVSAMELPTGWVKAPAPPRHEFNTGTLHKFHAAGDVDVQICSYQRGTPLSAKSSMALTKILAESSHILTHDEIWDLQEVLGNIMLEEEFALTSARTFVLKGRPVLAVEGHWLQLNCKSYSIFVAESDTGSTVQQIYFAAPPDRYDQNWNLAEAALESIIWADLI